MGVSGSVDQPPIRIATSPRKVRGAVWAASALIATVLLPLLTFGLYGVLPSLSKLGNAGLLATFGLLGTLVITTVHHWACAGRELKVITMDPSGLSLAQGDRKRVWAWSEVMEPTLLPNGAGVLFGSALTLRLEKRVFGDTFEVSPRELLAILTAARTRWGSPTFH